MSKNQIDTIIRIKELTSIIGLSKATIYRLMAEQKFPASTKLSTRAVGWHLSSVESWLASRKSAEV